MVIDTIVLVKQRHLLRVIFGPGSIEMLIKSSIITTMAIAVTMKNSKNIKLPKRQQTHAKWAVNEKCDNKNLSKSLKWIKLKLSFLIMGGNVQLS